MPRSGLPSDIEIGRDGNVGLGAPSMTISSPIGPGVPDADIVYGASGGNVYTHDLSDGSLVHTFAQEANTSAITDSHVAYAGDSGDVYIHDVFDGSLVHKINVGSQVRALDLSDSYITFGDSEYNTYVHDLSDGSLVYNLTKDLSEDQQDITSIGISESFVAYQDKDANTAVHTLSDGSLRFTIDFSNDVEGVDINESYVVSATDYFDQGSGHVNNTSDGSLEHKVGQDSNRAAISDSLFALDTDNNFLHVYNLSDGSLKYSIEPGFSTNSLALTERFFSYTRGNEDDIRVRKNSDESLVYTLEEATSPDTVDLRSNIEDDVP